MLVSLKVSFSKNNYHPIIRLQNTITFFTSKNLCFKESCDHIQGFQWLQLVIIEGYGTILGCHMQWSSQNGLEVLLEPKRACTILPGTHCIYFPSILRQSEPRIFRPSRRLSVTGCTGTTLRTATSTATYLPS